MRSAFSFYKSFDDAYQKLDDAQKIKYISAILDVQFLRVKVDDISFNEPLLDMAWSSQKQSIKNSIKGYLDSQRSEKVKEPYLGCYEPHKEPLEGGSQGPFKGIHEQGEGEGEEKEQVQDKEKEQVQYNDKPFIENVNRINDEKKILSKSGVEEFSNFWTEHNQTTGKMKWQEQEYFDIPKRMARWAKNNYSGNAKPTKDGYRPEMKNLTF